jgi:hypothetical protein
MSCEGKRAFFPQKCSTWEHSTKVSECSTWNIASELSPGTQNVPRGTFQQRNQQVRLGQECSTWNTTGRDGKVRYVPRGTFKSWRFHLPLRLVCGTCGPLGIWMRPEFDLDGRIELDLLASLFHLLLSWFGASGWPLSSGGHVRFMVLRCQLPGCGSPKEGREARVPK